MTERRNSTYVTMTQAELDAGAGTGLSADRIVIVDAVTAAPTGVTYDSGPAGQAPTVPVTADNINTVLQSAGGAGGAGAGGVSAAAADTGVQAGGTGYTSSISGTTVEYGRGGNGIVTVTGNEPAAVPANTGNGGHGRNPGALSGAAGTIIVRFATQSRSYQALAAFSGDAAAATGGILIGQFFKNSTTGAVQQRAT